MASNKFSLDNFAMRFVAAMFLVFATFNPLEPYSYFHWAVAPLFEDIANFSLVKGLVDAGVDVIVVDTAHGHNTV